MASLSSKGVVWLEDPGSTDVPLVGGKFASLSSLKKASVNVPPAFCVTSQAYSEFIAGFQEALRSAVTSADFSTLASLEQTAESIRAMIRSAPLPESISEMAKASYRELARRTGSGQDPPVAVRSSATLEDSSDSSLAGQHETYLWVTGEQQVIQKVQECWASVFTARSIRYRDSRGMDQLSEQMAVAVQSMVKSTASGVMFTLNPANGDPSKISIESSWGLGEAIVGGLVTPDLFVLDKVTFEVLEKRISKKEKEFAVSDGKVVERLVEEGRAAAQSVQDDVVLHLAKIGKTLEKQYGHPLDIEWAIDSEHAFPENVFILQARPETVWRQKSRGPLRDSGDAMDSLVEKLIRGEKIR